jgi:stage II sporulation protein AA (anti-sigma F factor antagonist)
MPPRTDAIDWTILAWSAEHVRAERIPRGGDAIYLRLSGIVTDRNSNEFEPQLLDASEYGRHVLVSLRDVTLLNSSGIGMLLKAHREIQGQGGRLILLDLPANVRQVIDFMKLGKILQIADDEQMAQEMLR